MSAVVVLTFEKRTAAAQFVRSMYAPEPDAASIGTAVFAGEVAAAIARPDKYCTCEGQQETGGRRKRGRPKRELGWTQDRKTGFFVCVHCGKPAKAIVTHFISSMLIGGIDMTPAILDTGEPRGLFEQRIMEAIAQAEKEGREPDLDSLTSHERTHLANTPNGLSDPTQGNTVLTETPGSTPRSASRKRKVHPRRDA
jgi:hypothetical protein